MVIEVEDCHTHLPQRLAYNFQHYYNGVSFFQVQDMIPRDLDRAVKSQMIELCSSFKIVFKRLID